MPLSSYTSAVPPRSVRSSRACSRSSWCRIIHASLPSTARPVETARVSVQMKMTYTLWIILLSYVILMCCLPVLSDFFQKLPLSDCPLYLRLLAGPDLENLMFILKENETGEVEVSFSILSKFVTVFVIFAQHNKHYHQR